jgi:large subunit ribosomal protein L10
MANPKKQLQVNELVDILKKNQHFSLLRFEKTPHTKMESLRKALKKSGSSLRVVKNTYFQKAVNKLSQDKKLSQYKEIHKLISALKENSALLTFGDDWSSGMNIFFTFSKEDKSLSYRIGCLDNKVYGADDMIRIAQLPGKQVLLSQMIGSMKSPVSHFIHAMKFNTQKLVYILNTKAKN